MTTIADLFRNWESEIKPLVIQQYGEDDGPALAESWNDYTDSELSGLRYHYCPAYDDEMPDDDREFILDAMGVVLTHSRIDSRNDLPAGTWDDAASHWRVVLKRNGQTFATNYSMGSAHRNPPDVCDVVNSLLLDSRCAADSLEDFADEFGHDMTDPKKKRETTRIYNACRKTREAMARLFTASELEELEELFSDY